MKYRTALGLLLALLTPVGLASAADDGYAMYVWKTGFDATVAGCDEAKFLAWDKASDPECYTHNWEDPVNRQWLWDTAKRPGREIDRLFISDIKPRLEPAYLAGNCSDPDVIAIREMLLDGHCKVSDVDLYALLSTNDVAVSEKDHVKYVVWYNDNCATSLYERFDGVAVNNEAWNDVQCVSLSGEETYLDNLQTVADEAALQINGTLATHYSIGWKWSFCGSTEVTVDWGGTVQQATYHMIDIFDSVDVQVARVDPVDAADRAVTAGYAHAVGQGKPFFVLAYVNKNTTCTSNHFPFDCGVSWTLPTRTDDYVMEQVFDGFPANGVPEARGGIHFFRGAYSSGAHPDWPSYYSGSVVPCAIAEAPVPLVFETVNDISWPPVIGATGYEVARARSPRFDTGCRRLTTTPNPQASDGEQPAPSTLFTYLVRVHEPEPGSWGEGSDGQPRVFQCQ